MTIILGSCGRREEPPAGIMSHAEMVQTLSELYISEEKVVRLNLQPDSAKRVFQVMRDKVFEKAGVANDRFKASFDYYMDRPAEMELIYTALVDSLQLREQRAPNPIVQ